MAYEEYQQNPVEERYCYETRWKTEKLEQMTSLIG
jgi:hypothetical protein